jgi:hypothetical protein
MNNDQKDLLIANLKAEIFEIKQREGGDMSSVKDQLA